MSRSLTNKKTNLYDIVTKIYIDIPKHTRIVLIIFFISLSVHVASFLSVGFSDLFSEKIASVFRTVISTVTGWIPFSIAETFLLMLPVMLILYFVIANDYFIKQGHSLKPLVYAIISIILSLYSIAVFTFMTGYSNSTLDKRLGIESKPVYADELVSTADIVYSKINIINDNISYTPDGFSNMPYSLFEMSDKLIMTYEKCSQDYKFLHNVNAKIKPIALSEAMSYTHITGLYTYFTGEANIDAAFPDYTLPYTAAHEFAHQRGIARENEANFVAFLICINSEDSYIQYSGYMNMLEYLLNALYSADKDKYQQFYSIMDARTKAELRAYSNFFDKYRESAISKVSGAVNDTYLKLQGTEGSKSYGMVVDLAVAYYK